MSGIEWIRCFMQRPTDLLLRKPECTSVSRSMAFNKPVVKNLFKKYATGLWPVNSLIFSDTDFLPSSITNKSLNEENNPDEVLDSPVQENPQSSQPSTSKAIVEPDRIERNTPCIIKEKTPSPIPKFSEFQCPRLEDVRPFSKATFEEKKRKNNRKSKSSIYTDTPEFINRQNTEVEKKRKSVKEKKPVQRSLTKENKKRRQDSSSNESSVDVVVSNSSDDEESFQKEINLISPDDMFLKMILY
ncbi:hypothetical protein ILUMI_01449 [Ignelater luminosus]|uniref:Uncharacterized protein n=1 Tax=Ignelater luminosus TaxID=2038154 RepID=A0A8K0DFD0_IGNLU|nr:hypothetical protein ILUMI_01449 [Ignelater luminosus]